MMDEKRSKVGWRIHSQKNLKKTTDEMAEKERNVIWGQFEKSRLSWKSASWKYADYSAMCQFMQIFSN